jgi:hydroxypyruvate isomerase
MTKIVAVTGNEIQGISCALQHQTVVETLKAGAPLAEDAGMTIVLEPLNIRDHRGYFLQTAAEGAYIIDEVASPAVRLLYDVYHQQITEGDLIPNITKYIDRIGHIHIGDTPGRNEPGTGEINYPNIFKTIDSLGYTGFVTLECGCTRDVAEATKDIFAMLPQA